MGELFQPGDFVDVQGISKGRGFAGSIKRHGMGRAPATHGAPFQRQRGSTGQSATPARTHKGVRGAGHMGNCSMTVQSLRIVAVRPEDNQILIEGAVPGPTKGIVALCKALKKRSPNAS